MAAPVLFDNVSLSNFAAVGRLDLLETRYGYRTPHWVGAVHAEAMEAVRVGVTYMQAVLDAGWLGDPLAPPTRLKDRKELATIHIGLNDGRRPPEHHLGEAESMYWAGTYGGVFVTDDLGAMGFARRRFPGLRVIDTVDVLRECFENAEVGCPEAWDVLQAMLEAGRAIRPRRPATHEDVCPPTGRR